MAGGQYSAILKMKKYRTINRKNEITLNTTKEFHGESLEDKVKRTTESKAPIEAISPMIYTERKDGVRPEFNIRTDRFEVAQNAMDSITNGIRQKREERMNAATAKPDADSKVN